MDEVDPISGVWFSEVGSKLEIEVRGSELHGFFHSTEGPDGKFRLLGSVDPDPKLPNRSLSFSVSWITEDTPNEYRSVTSYTGQFHRSGGEAVLNTIFLLANETSPSRQYASTFIGYDNFGRVQPSQEQIDHARKLRKPAYSSGREK